MSAKVIAIYNFKGGTGKTTITYNLGSILAEKGYKVCMIDCDPQCNLSMATGFYPAEEFNLAKILHKEMEPFENQVINVPYPFNFWVVPAWYTLAKIREQDLFFLKEHCLEKIRDRYDIILLDCQPDLGGAMVRNCFFGADEVLIPVNSDMFSLRPLDLVIETVEAFRPLNRNLKVTGIVQNEILTKSQAAPISRDILEENYSQFLFKSIIKRKEDFNKSQSEQTPLNILFPKTAREAGLYQVADEFILRFELPKTSNIKMN